MVERISITPNKIETRDSGNNITFSTNEYYLRSDNVGTFKMGGISRTPSIAGTDSSEPYEYPDDANNLGFLTNFLLTGDLSNQYVLTKGMPRSVSHWIPSEPGTTFSSYYYPPPLAAPGPVVGVTEYQSVDDVVFLYSGDNPGTPTLITSSKLILRFTRFLTPPDYNTVSSIISCYPEIDYAAYMLDNPGFFYKLHVLNTWADGQFVNIANPANVIGITTTTISYSIPYIFAGVPQQTLSISVTP